MKRYALGVAGFLIVVSLLIVGGTIVVERALQDVIAARDAKRGPR